VCDTVKGVFKRVTQLRVFSSVRHSYVWVFKCVCVFKNYEQQQLSVSVCSMLASKLNMSPEDAERWIVNLIRNARLDAKIDSKLVGTYCPLINHSELFKKILPLIIPVNYTVHILYP